MTSTTAGADLSASRGTPDPTTVPLPIRATIALAIGVVAALLAWIRLPAIARETVWAEDGKYFLGDQLAHGLARSLFAPYEGYLQVLPRLMAFVAVHAAPIASYSVTMAALASVVVGALAALVWVLSARWIASPIARAALCLAPALAPVSPIEILGNGANIHWFVLFATPWVFLAVPRTWGRSVALGIVALLAALSEIQMLLFVPLLAVRIRDARRWPILVGAVVGLGCEVGASIAFPRTTPLAKPVPPHDIVLGYLLEPLPQTFTANTRYPGIVDAEHGLVPFIVLLVAVVAVLVVSAVLGRLRHRWLLLTLAGASVVTWTAALVANHGGFGDADLVPAALRDLGTSRYAAVASVFLVSALAVAADALLARGRGRGRGRMRTDGPRQIAGTSGVIGGVGLIGGVGVIGGVGLLVVLGVVFATSFHVTQSNRESGPAWAPQVHQAALRCERNPSVGAVVIRTAPHPPWQVSVPCARITDR